MGMQLLVHLCLISTGFERKDVPALQDPSLELTNCVSAINIQWFIQHCCDDKYFNFVVSRERKWHVLFQQMQLDELDPNGAVGDLDWLRVFAHNWKQSLAYT